uniref:Protein FAR1-RELATED SEQUENCE n=1 Tax=Aegilops tauschii subsp. strangulata TaxID=200361 RepID=A0A453C1U2_AEGTS
GGLEWRVTGFSNHHNHELLRQDEQMMRIMELEKCVQPGSLPFTEKDVRNLIHSFRRFELEEESVDLLQMCRNVKEKDPNFKYDFTKDANNCVENIAWSYASSIQSYEVFGDAVVLDTTHRLTSIDMTLGIWIGMNNHGMPCFFSCALLREGNLQSFIWALQVFLNFMNRKAPQTVLTDQNMHLKEAVQKELPNTKHALSIGLIASRFPSWFNAVLGRHYNDWENEFYRLHNMESTMDFDLGWSDMGWLLCREFQK